jgi:hypothetical protein
MEYNETSPECPLCEGWHFSLSHRTEPDRLYPIVQVSHVCRVRRQTTKPGSAGCPSPDEHASGCGGGSSGDPGARNKDVRSMIRKNEAAKDGEICQDSDGGQCHRSSPDSAANDNPCQSCCRTAHGNRLIIPLRRILMGRKTRQAGLNRRDAPQSPLQPDTTLI